jgi:YegS/Rv2252/BmrU family lipid kinase
MLYFIVNEKSRSGKGAAIWKEIKAALKKKNIAYNAWVTEYEGHATELAANICAQNDDDICLVVVGGDGTANEVINGMTNFENVRFGVIPTGSGNDLARGIGISGSPADQLNNILARIDEGRDSAWVMDLGDVSWNGGESSRKFAISAGAGLDALVCKKALKSKIKDFLNVLHLGKLTYIVLTVQSLFTMQTADAVVQFDKRKKHDHTRKNICFSAMNFRAEGGGVPMAPKADATDGKLSICNVSGVPKLLTFFCLPFLATGTHTWIKAFEITDCHRSHIKLSRPMTVHADGEYCGELTEMIFTCLPGKLRVLK